MTDRDHQNVDNWFTYKPPQGDQAARYSTIRERAGELGHIIVELCPPCADRTDALRKLREVVYAANASIACNEVHVSLGPERVDLELHELP